MKLADKNCYPQTIDTIDNDKYTGLTFRERLIVALAGNSAMVVTIQTRVSPDKIEQHTQPESTATKIIEQADAIIKQLEEERK